jgi:hypothetical protein
LIWFAARSISAALGYGFSDCTIRSSFSLFRM